MYDRFVTDNPQNFFRDLPVRLCGVDSATFTFYAEIERWLCHIPETEGPYYVEQIGRRALLYDLSRHRFWEKLHDTFNEALGALVASQKIWMQRNTFHPTELEPDSRPRRKRSSLIHYLEVKTINHFQEERDSWYREPPLRCAPPLTSELKKKIEDTYLGAISQLTAPARAKAAKKIALLVLDADYTFDPTNKTVADAVIDYLRVIERPDFEIICHVRSPWN